MRFGAESIAAKTARMGVLVVLAACVDRPDLETTVTAGRFDAGAAKEDASDAAAEVSTVPTTPDPAAGAPPWTSGFRLRARIMDGLAGARLLAYWQDTVLRFGCSFAVASDGHVRCLPLDEDLP